MSNSVSIGGGCSESSDVSEATYKQEVRDLKSELEKLSKARKKLDVRIWRGNIEAAEKRLNTPCEEETQLMKMPASEERERMMTALQEKRRKQKSGLETIKKELQELQRMRSEWFMPPRHEELVLMIGGGEGEGKELEELKEMTTEEWFMQRHEVLGRMITIAARGGGGKGEGKEKEQLIDETSRLERMRRAEDEWKILEAQRIKKIEEWTMDEKERWRNEKEIWTTNEKERWMNEKEQLTAYKKEQWMMMKLVEELDDWLQEVKALETEVGKLIKQVSEEIDESRPGFTCSVNQKSSQELREEMAAKLEYVIALNKQAALISDVGRFVTEVHEDEELAIVDIQLPIFDQLWRRFEEKEVGIVGLYGIRGVGKTTLLKQINKKLLDDKRNEMVIWVQVSKDLQLEKIQQQIWSKIGPVDETWKGRSLEEKASEIYKILSQNKFVLLMDDLWERVDLKRVGVPFPDPDNGSKIVFATRSFKICALMEADLEFKVECVEFDEAWKIFRSNVGDEILGPVNRNHLWLVEDVVKRCHGLPLALISVVQILAHYKREPEPWRYVLLFSFTDLNAILERHVYPSLKSSYDNLQKDILKTCLLYCILYPSEYKISKIDLIDQWIGEGFLDAKLGAQKQGYSIINALVDVCLLEDEGDCVKMLKIIHNMTSWVASKFEKEENYFARPAAGLTCISDVDQHVKRMSVMRNEMKLLQGSAKTKWLHLETLFINYIDLRLIKVDFFRDLFSLKVLNLSGNDSLDKLPAQMSLNLVSLQHLDLSRTGIVELPEELKNLKKLKCLNLEHTRPQIPQQLISNIYTLHVLRMFQCHFTSMSSERLSKPLIEELLIEELLCLENLNMLTITLKDFKALQKFLSSHRLQNCTQSLWLRSLQQPKAIKVALADLKHLKTLNISNCEMLEELKVDFEREEVLSIRECSFYFLNEVQIEFCPKLRDLTWLVLAPNLKRLTVSDCSGMEAIIDMGRLSEFPEMMARNLIPFSKVTYLKLEKLPNLQSIYYSDLLLAGANIDVDESLKPLLRIS